MTWRRYDVSIESLCGPTPCDLFSPGSEDVSGYFTILSLCCWSASKKRLNAVGGRESDSAISDVKVVERMDICEM